MDNLISELKSFEAYRFNYDRCLNSYTSNNKFKEAVIKHKVNILLGLFDDLLIDRNGSCNWENIDILMDSGYSVGPGERDRFGWLTGIVYTNKGYIVFG